MLTCYTYNCFKCFRMFLELLYQRTHLNSLRTCAENKHNSFHFIYHLMLVVMFYEKGAYYDIYVQDYLMKSFLFIAPGQSSSSYFECLLLYSGTISFITLTMAMSSKERETSIRRRSFSQAVA